MASHDDVYGLAPEQLGVSAASACETNLTDDKRQAVQSYLTQLGPELQSRYGRQTEYEPNKVRETALAIGLNIDYVCWAYILFCSQSAFRSIHESAGEVCDYDGMRSAVGSTFFGGASDFDVIGVVDVISSGSVEAVASGTIEATGALASFDWSGLLDWS